MPQADLPDLTPLEREIVTLKAVLDMIGDMVNHETMTIHSSDPNSSVMFKTRTHMAFFSIVLVDLLSERDGILKDRKNYIGRLKVISTNPLMGEIQDILELREAVCAFDAWLSEEVTIQNRWFPSLDLQVDLSIKRQDFIRICGDIAKHNFTRLTVAADKLRKILGDNNQPFSLDKCILALQDFRTQFYDDIFLYHSSTIAEFLNNIWWGIYSYAAPVRGRCVENRYDGELHLNAYSYSYPVDVTSELGKACFWGLMNDVMQPPYIRRFEVAKYLKERY